MRKIPLTIDKELLGKMEKIAQRRCITLNDCINFALKEYVDNFEDFYKTDLNEASSTEHTFFLSIGK